MTRCRVRKRAAPTVSSSRLPCHRTVDIFFKDIFYNGLLGSLREKKKKRQDRFISRQDRFETQLHEVGLNGNLKVNLIKGILSFPDSELDDNFFRTN